MPSRREGPISHGPAEPADRPGADLLQLDPLDAPPRELAGWLTTQLRDAVLDGRLAAGARLPATRALAHDLGVSRGVVVEAYGRLAEEGLVSPVVGAGTTVTAPAVARGSARRIPSTGPTGPWSDPSSGGLPGGLPGHHFGRDAGPVEIDLWPGVPDLTAFPRAAWLRAESAVLAVAGPRELGYGEPSGHPALRQQLASWLGRTRGVRAGPDDLVIVAGVAQGLMLLAQVLHGHGHDRIAVEDPGSRGVRDTLARWGLAPVAVPVDEEGLDVARLRDLPTSPATRAVVLTPAHQYPTGVVLAPRRRRDVLAWAAERDGVVIEDDYDAEHRYDRRPVPALHAGAPDLVAYTGSTSKTLAPGLRIGWLVVPRRLHAEVVEAKYAADITNPALPQLVLARLLADGAFERHLRLARRHQRARRDALLGELLALIPQGRVHGVPAGLHLLLTVPAGDDVEAALVDRLAHDGVRVQPLSMHRTAPGPAGLVLGYAAVRPDRLREAARRIARAVADLAPAVDRPPAP